MTLGETIDQYIEHRRSTGVAFDSGAAVLNTFCRTVGRETPCADISEASVRAFLNAHGPPNRYWQRKHSVLSGFYSYATRRGHATGNPLPRECPRLSPPLVPYIYSRAEIRSLLEAIPDCLPTHSSMTSAVLRTLVLLLYGAGLRVGEAIGLRLRDVDLPTALLTVRRAKFHKTRLVPVGPDLLGALQAYAPERSGARLPVDDDAFLTDRRGASLRYKNVRHAFARVRKSAGIARSDGARYQPRLHDLRHSFATDRLTDWYRQGKDVQRLLPLLSVYLGHASVAETEPYLTMTPALLGLAGNRFERYASAEEGGGNG